MHRTRTAQRTSTDIAPFTSRRSLAAALVAGSLVFGVAACGNDDSANNASGANSTAAVDTNGNSNNDAPTVNQSNASFPITVKHAFGETTINEAPQRIATVAWANHEVPLALGIAPVGISKATFGDDNDDGILPWVDEKLTELGATGDKKPAVFDETDGIPFEEVAATKPDIILASYSGLTQEDYDTLSKIAPVVAYPDIPWGTSLEDMITMNATAIGQKEAGDKLIAELKKQTADALEEHSDLKDKKVLFTSFGGSSDPSKLGFYSTKDPRMGFLVDNGFAAPKIVADESAKSDEFWIEVSTEKPELFDDVDFLVSYSSGNKADDEKTVKEMQADPLLSKIPAVAKGNIAFLENGPIGAAANPSPLSISWGIERYFDALDDGLES